MRSWERVGTVASGGPQQARGPIERQIRPLERMRMPVATRGKKDDHVITKPPPHGYGWLRLHATCYPCHPPARAARWTPSPGRWCHSPCRAPPASRGMEKCFHLAEFFKLGICDGLLLHQDMDGTHRERCAIAFVWKKIINNTGSQGRTAELLNHVLFF